MTICAAAKLENRKAMMKTDRKPLQIRWIALGAIVLIAAVTISSLTQTRRALTTAGNSSLNVITDRRVYAEPPAPALPRAGGTFVDPTFGTTIMRVTDDTDGKSCHNYYSYWPTFNLDSTRFFVACDNMPRLYRFDPNSFQI